MSNKNTTRYFSKIQEKTLAKEVNGRVQPNSGATPFQKGDVKTDEWLFDAKTSMTDKQSYSIKKADLIKLEDERIQMRKDYCAIVFNFGMNQDNVYVVPKKHFLSLLEELDTLRKQ